MFLGGTHFKEHVKVSFGRAGISLSNTLPYGTIQLSEMSDSQAHSARRKKERKKFREITWLQGLYSLIPKASEVTV